MTTLSTEIDAFVASQNQNRGLAGEEVALDYDALTTTVPTGGNTVTGITAIVSGAATIALGSGYNAVIIQGAHSTTAAATGLPDSFAISTDANGVVTLLDENTQQTQVVTGDSYLIFNGGATNTDGSFQSIVMVERGVNAEVAALYNAALGRLPDLAGLEYYAVRLANGEQTIQQQAANFIASPEFTTRFAAAALPADNGGTNDAAFVTALYANVLHRAAAASEIEYYTAALQNSEAGSIVNQTNAVSWSRAQELINFALSPENQTDISSWLINTSNGAYADTGFVLPGSVSVSTALGVAAGGTIDTADIDTSTITGGSATANGGWNPNGSGGILLTTTNNNIASTTFSGGVLYTAENNIIIELSANFPSADFSSATNTKIYSAPTGGGLFIYQDVYYTGKSETIIEGSGNILNLTGKGNYMYASQDGIYSYGITHGAPAVLIVNGATTGDYIEFNNNHGAAPGATGPQVDIIETPAAGTKIQGSSYISPTYGTSTPTPAGYWFPTTTIAINVGTVSGNTAADMATAAAAVYQPTTNHTGDPDLGQEEVVFYGKGVNNDTVVYKWFADDSHQVSATTMVAGLDLIGVTPTQFESMLKF